MRLLSALILLVCAVTASFSNVASATQTVPAAPSHTLSIGHDAFLLDGQPFVIRCGEVHAARVPREYWRHRLQLARAMGLNTVCAYLFWNQHEPREGQFNWSGQADIAEFCRIAQQEGLWVVLRPGPYACAEWEMGGLPWWLLKTDDIQLRSRDPRFIAAARSYLKEVGRVLAPLQITRGGPILLVQAENEYGFYGKDAAYMGDIRQALLDAGFDVPLFACNPVSTLRNGYRDDLFPVVNFGSNPEGAFKALREVLPEGLLMCGEFYPGWFDTWGQPHHRGDTARYLQDLETMLKMKASFSIYMAHGGTSFGFTTGADRPFKPDTSSYDYDALISEAGWTTDKFFKTRAVFEKYLQPGETLTEPPASPPVITIPTTRATGFAPLLSELPGLATAYDEYPLNFEKLDQPYGLVLYRTTILAGPAAELRADAVNDIGLVYLDSVRVGAFDRRSRSFSIQLPAREKPAVLDILVEAMGRVNFGKEVHDRKGLRGPVRLGTTELRDWEMFSLPLDDAHLARLNYAKTAPLPPAKMDRFWNRSSNNQTDSGIRSTTSNLRDPKVANQVNSPGFHRFEIDLKTIGDTFLDVRAFSKGMVWVNGHNLGRYWNIGPQQTMFVPGPWLRVGRNEIVVFDLLGPTTDATLSGLAQPILDQLRPELDTLVIRQTQPPRRRVEGEPVLTGSFPRGSETREVRLTAPVRARYFTMEALNAHDGGKFTSIADLSILGADGTPLNSQSWTIAGVDSEETAKEAAGASNAIDGQISNFWHSRWSGTAAPAHPHWLTLDLGREETITGFVYVPRQGTDKDATGRIKDYQIYVGAKLITAP